MALPPLHDTITAIATAPGSGAVGIVRLSGPQSYQVASALFCAKRGHDLLQLPPAQVTYGALYEPATYGEERELIDEALLLNFHAPYSYTGEDVIEFQTHGGPAVLRRVLQLTQTCGARLAQPGEFTLRAYLHGRIDLVQAESVLHVVNAQSDSARRNAALGLSRALSDELQLIQDDITRVYGNIQAVFDYPEEGVPESEYHTPLLRAKQRVEQLLHTAQAGRLMQGGAKLALIGRPNAGKSSLLNALLGYERSIVSSQAGTTRDYLEAPLELAGVPLIAIDTAGIRHTHDEIEASGVSRAKTLAKEADVTLLLIPANQHPSEEDRALIAEVPPPRLFVVASKADLAGNKGLDWEMAEPIVRVSTQDHTGLEQLKQAIGETLLGDVGSAELWITSERHADILQRVLVLIERALTMPDDLASLDLAEALQALAEMTGRGDVGEEALAHIFANFCVGK